MKKNKKEFFYVLLLLFIQPFAKAQNSFDSSFADAVSVYKKTMGENIHLFNGSEYIDYDHRISGNPFFGSLHFTDGSVVYDDITYTHIQMIYDILNDDVIIKNYNGIALLLTKEKISSFNVTGHHFVKIMADSAATGLKTGFYDVLYDGTTKLLVKRKKEITEKIEMQNLESSFTQHDQYYILKDTVYYPAHDKNAALRALKDRKSELKKFIHQDKIKFRKDFETALLKTVAYYNSLNTPR
ncbi:MAG TPA: hypothetical protein VFW07_08035 [Parafilimonas sp.]|nr:hypothetical protein [Parafilimonas sp.]